MKPIDQGTATERPERRPSVGWVKWLFVAFAAAAGGYFVFSWVRAHQGRNAFQSQVRALVDRAEFQEARDLIVGQWVATEPESAEAQYFLGRSLLGLDRPQEALVAFGKALELGYPQADLERIIGIVLARSGRVTQAQSMLEQDLARHPAPDAERDEAIAKIDADLYRFGSALEAVERWAKAAPHAPEPYVLKAKLSNEMNAGSDLVADAYREALKRDPDLLSARLGLADALRLQGSYSQALTEYETVLKRQPSDAGTLAGAGLAALADGQEDRAARYLDEAMKANPELSNAMDGRAAIALRHREYAKALPWIDQALKIDPLNAELHYRRSLALDGLGRGEEALAEREATARLRKEGVQLDDLRKKIMRAPRDVAIQAQLARWLLSHGRAEEGLVWAERVMTTSGDSSEHRRDVAAELATYYEAQGNAGRANYYRVIAGE